MAARRKQQLPQQFIMSDSEFSIQFKMTVKGKEALRAVRRPMWAFLLATILVACVIAIPKMSTLLAALNRFRGQ